MGTQTDGVITDGLVPRAVPLAGPGQSPGLNFPSQDRSRQETDMRSPPAMRPMGIEWLWIVRGRAVRTFWTAIEEALRREPGR